LFTDLIEASEVLGTDVDFRNTLKETRQKLFPLQIGRKGEHRPLHQNFLRPRKKRSAFVVMRAQAGAADGRSTGGQDCLMAIMHTNSSVNC
jgi:hypothetical protein